MAGAALVASTLLAVPHIGWSAAPIVVAIDPGHGGSNLGAASPSRPATNGVLEKEVTLALARRISALLAEQSTPGLPVTAVLCRTADVLIPIRARARCARDSGAQLFVSLHANAVPAGVAPGSRQGFGVFVLGPKEVEDDAALAVLEQRDDADAVWAAHEVRAAAERSIRLAQEMALHLGLAARRGVPGITQAEATRLAYGAVHQAGAALDVLRGSGAPAVLVEIGFLDHPEEGARLATPAGREPIATALVEAIRAYLAASEVAVATPALTLGSPERPRRATRGK